jgi:RNA polymerase sigma-70 factor (ECF subfamily)
MADSLAAPALRDELLVQGLREGQPEAYRVMVETYLPQIYRLAYGITQDVMEAQDVTQDVLLAVFRRVEAFEERSAVLTWMYRITVNASLDRVRSRRRRRETVPLDEFLPTFTEEGRHAQEIVDWSQAPLDHLLSAEARRTIQEAIDSLPEDLKAVLVMKDVEGFSLRDMGEILELSLPAVKSRLHRARLALRGMLSSYFRETMRHGTHEGS